MKAESWELTLSLKHQLKAAVKFFLRDHKACGSPLWENATHRLPPEAAAHWEVWCPWVALLAFLFTVQIFKNLFIYLFILVLGRNVFSYQTEGQV